MVFKVLYQASSYEVPVREKTQTIYVEAENEEEVRKKLADRDYNIEFVQKLEGDFLEYEKSSPNFKVEEI